MKILNIDPFALSTRKVSMNGISYPVEEPTLQEYIDSLKASEALEASEALKAVEADGGSPNKVDLVESFENAAAAISKAIPTMPLASIMALKLPAMTAMLNFIRGDDTGTVEGTRSGGDAEKKPS